MAVFIRLRMSHILNYTHIRAEDDIHIHTYKTVQYTHENES